jgi:hypothetical protein
MMPTIDACAGPFATTITELNWPQNVPVAPVKLRKKPFASHGIGARVDTVVSRLMGVKDLPT